MSISIRTTKMMVDALQINKLGNPTASSQDWWTDFDGGQGILAGAAVGYSFANQNPNSPLAGFRVEMEYFYRESKHDQNQPDY